MEGKEGRQEGRREGQMEGWGDVRKRRERIVTRLEATNEMTCPFSLLYC